MKYLFLICFCMIISVELMSQCPDCYVKTGSNLISNGDFENGYSGFSSDYMIGNRGPGFYLVDRDASFYYPPYTGRDHSTGNSNFLIVDGDSTLGKRVWYQEINILPNTDYYFSCWVTNIFVPPVTELQFSINGADIGDVFSPTLTYNEWHHFFVKWNSGINTTARLAINNRVIIFQGNDFGLDDISFTTCQPDPFFNISIGNDTMICSEDSIRLDAGRGFSSYLWNTGAINRSINSHGEGFYSVEASIDGCFARDTMRLGFLPLPFIGFDSDYIICEENEDSIQLAVDTDYQTKWSPSGETVHQLVFNKAGDWLCMVTDKDGCTNQADFSIHNLCYPLIYVPNAFYPNGDLLNDVFLASGSYIVGFRMMIYDRWGEKLFESDNMQLGWDGNYRERPCQPDVYFWTIEYYGLSADKQKIEGRTKGTVTLLR